MSIFLGTADHVVVYLQKLMDELLRLQFSDLLKIIAHGVKDVKIIVRAAEEDLVADYDATKQRITIHIKVSHVS
jgi:hypothetical protein